MASISLTYRQKLSVNVNADDGRTCIMSDVFMPWVDFIRVYVLNPVVFSPFRILVSLFHMAPRNLDSEYLRALHCCKLLCVYISGGFNLKFLLSFLNIGALFCGPRLRMSINCSVVFSSFCLSGNTTKRH